MGGLLGCGSRQSVNLPVNYGLITTRNDYELAQLLGMSNQEYLYQRMKREEEFQRQKMQAQMNVHYGMAMHRWQDSWINDSPTPQPLATLSSSSLDTSSNPYSCTSSNSQDIDWITPKKIWSFAVFLVTLMGFWMDFQQILNLLQPILTK